MNVENVRGIVWDLDGTLIDSFGIFEQIISDVVAETGHEMPTHEYMLSNYHGSLEDTIQTILGIETAEELDTVLTNFLEKQEHHYAGDLETHLFKDALMLAREATRLGIHQLLVTNRAHARRGSASPRFIVAATTLSECITEIRTGDEVEFRKPDKRSVIEWLESLGLSPDEILIIGDQHVDAQLAINAGARALLVKRNGNIPHLEPLLSKDKDRILLVDSLEEAKLVQ